MFVDEDQVRYKVRIREGQLQILEDRSGVGNPDRKIRCVRVPEGANARYVVIVEQDSEHLHALCLIYFLHLRQYLRGPLAMRAGGVHESQHDGLALVCAQQFLRAVAHVEHEFRRFARNLGSHAGGSEHGRGKGNECWNFGHTPISVLRVLTSAYRASLVYTEGRRVIEARDVETRSSIQEHVHGYALPVIATGVVIAILYLGRVVFITAITAIIIALILEPFVGILIRLRVPRTIATFLVGVTAALALYFGGLAAWNQLSGLAGDVPAFNQNLTAFIGRVSYRLEVAEDAATRLIPVRKPEPVVVPPPPPPVARGRNRRKTAAEPAAVPETAQPGAIPEVRIHEDRNPINDYIYAHLGTVYEFLLMASFVPFLVYFMLSWRDHIYRAFLRFFNGPDRVAAARSLEGVAEMARAFVVGNFLIGALLAALSWGAFSIIHIPYPFLTGVLSGFLSLVPYAGMPLALIPPLLAAIAGGDRGATVLLALIIVLTLHLTAMNILYPKIVGARVHLNPLVVTFSLMFWGFLWDAAGLVLAIPITAAIKAVCDNVVGLRPWGRFLGD